MVISDGVGEYAFFANEIFGKYVNLLLNLFQFKGNPIFKTKK